MSSPPQYFHRVAESAARRWNQLEADPELAGPWHQLFKQVQSPRHVLSELLQNADDAGATEASVTIQDGVFTFDHNGEDFSEDQFKSLCGFGYSNKRALHTIGFRGVGFKSTFSLGDHVELSTPSLSVLFHRQRFSEPCWSRQGCRSDKSTCISVRISDQHRKREVEKNLEEWVRSPVALLFFANIRLLRIGEQSVGWSDLGQGPIPGSEWMARHDDRGHAFLLVRSPSESFPREALEEILQERMIGTAEQGEFPPCEVEVVLGTKGRLFVVLPTGVETALPFACNAPFIQDPARLKIKDPETSPTNRWLLERCGKLGASAMLGWLRDSKTTTIDRARAYGLLPDIDPHDNSLEGVCGTIVKDSFGKVLNGKRFLLTDEGTVVPAGESVMLPDEVLGVWPAAQAATLFDNKRRRALSHHIKAGDREKLLKWGVVEEINKETLLETLEREHLPKPESWRRLLNLWSYIAPEVTTYWSRIQPRELRIVPVHGRDVLYAATEAVRLGEKKLLQSEEDWEFLALHLIVLNQNWTKFLADQRREAEENNDRDALKEVNAAYAVLGKLGLDETSDASRVIDRVAADFFEQGQKRVSIADGTRLAQIAAKLGAKVGDQFRYATRDCCWRSPSDNVLFDEDGTLEELLPDPYRPAHLLHTEYAQTLRSCTREEWPKWALSSRSGLLSFVPIATKYHTTIYGQKKLERQLLNRGLKESLEYPYASEHFFIENWDFNEACWAHWKKLSLEDGSVWGRVVERIMAQPENYWRSVGSARVFQVARNGHTREITSGVLPPSWVVRLRDLPCVRDTRGLYHKPEAVLRRSAETEALIDVEPFIHSSLDNPSTVPLLDLLGVRSAPTGPERLLDYLRALSKAEKPPVHEVDKWYRRLDQLVTACSTTDLERIKLTFTSEKLILSASGSWVNSSAVFLSSDEEDVPGAEVIRSSVEDLMLWRRIGVPERPSIEIAIQWLKELPSGQRVDLDDMRRVHALLARHPVRIWEECRHWLNLAGEWMPVDSLAHVLTMQSLIPWKNLHEWVKQATADLQRLSVEVTAAPPFSRLPTLASAIEDRLPQTPSINGPPKQLDWLNTFGIELSRVELDDEQEMNRVKTVAGELAVTSLQGTRQLEITPYLYGTPAGTPRRADVVWLNRVLYVDRLPQAKLAKRVPEEIGKVFNRPDIKAALDYSFDRSPETVRAYLAENFKLARQQEVETTVGNETGAALPASAQESEGAGKDSQSPDELVGVICAESSTGEPVALESGEGQQPGHDEVGGEVSRPRIQPKPPKPSIMERFALKHGFRKDGDNRFFHADGSWISRTNGLLFPWERRTAAGSRVRCYWPRDHCLEEAPLEIGAETWRLVDKSPETYALVLADPQGEPIEMTGVEVRALLEQGKLKLYPAAYRLVADSE